MISSCSSSTGWTFLCYAAMSVLDCALFLGRILYWLGYVRVAFGALNVESQCSWAAVTVLDKVLTMSSWSLVEAKMHVKVSIGSCGILWEITVTVGLRSRGVWRSLCCESVFFSRAELLQPVEIPQVQFLVRW